MKEKKHLSKFNLIEIILAIGVVALGMAAVLALLPPALNANVDSMGDSDAAEIASNMVTYIDKVALECAGTTSEFKKVEGDTRTAAEITAADENTWKTEMEKRFTESAPGANSVAIPGSTFTNLLDEPFNQFNVESGSKDKPQWMTYVKTDADGTSTPVANVYVWMQKVEAVSSSNPGGINYPDSGTVVQNRSLYRFYIKVCWPATAPADATNRQERIFIHEVLRPVKQ